MSTSVHLSVSQACSSTLDLDRLPVVALSSEPDNSSEDGGMTVTTKIALVVIPSEYSYTSIFKEVEV